MESQFNLNYEQGSPIARILDAGTKLDKIYITKNDNSFLTDIKKIKGKQCPYCFKDFTRRFNMLRHLEHSCYFVIAGIVDDLDKNDFYSNINVGNSLLIPLPRNYRECIYIAGSNGCGKSFFCRQYINSFVKVFPEKDIIMFTTIPNDESFSDLPEKLGDSFIKIMVNDNLLNDKINVKQELSNSLVIFDDIIKSSNSSQLNRYMIKLRDDVLDNGRDQANNGRDIYCLMTNHLLTDYIKTRSAIAESTCIVLFPGSGVNITNILKNYCGLERNQIQKIKSLNTRWVCIYKRYPMYVLYQHGVYLL